MDLSSLNYAQLCRSIETLAMQQNDKDCIITVNIDTKTCIWIYLPCAGSVFCLFNCSLFLREDQQSCPELLFRIYRLALTLSCVG